MVKKKNIVIEDGTDKQSQNSQPLPSEDERSADAPADASEASAEDLTAELTDIEGKLAAAQAEARENHDRMLRMAAELDNFRKRAARELDDMKKYANENLLRQILTVVDNLERAVASGAGENGNGQSVLDGVALTLAEITKILEKHHVSPIQSLGEPFDPAFHQAMCQEESTDQPPNTVVKEFQKGYMLHDRLLRPAMVVVSKAAQNGQPNDKTVDTNV